MIHFGRRSGVAQTLCGGRRRSVWTMSTHPRHLWLGVAALLCIGAATAAFAQTDASETPTTAPAAAATEAPPPIAATTTQPAATLSTGAYYGAWVIAPPLVAIILAIAFQQVLPALFIGALAAGYMAAFHGHAVDAVWHEHWLIVGARTTVEGHLLGSIASSGNARIITFTLLIGGMVGVMLRSGATAGLIRAVARWAASRRNTQVSAWGAGLLVFFDDYANAMIVGPTMRPIADRYQISRAKLAYIVDSTAAPVASIALVGTWIGVEISYIQQGFDLVADNAPAFMNGQTAYGAFLQSIPYRFYAILALVMVLWVGLLNRDFGPMLRAERNLDDAVDKGLAQSTAYAPAWHAIAPIVVLLGFTTFLVFLSGYLAVAGSDLAGLAYWRELLYRAEASYAILWGSLAALLTSIALALGAGKLSLSETFSAMNDAMSRMLPTLVVLVLAWTLSSAMRPLELGEVATELLADGGFEPRWLPSLTFLAACVVSFATGTSYGTMGILCPAVITISAGLLADAPPDVALPIFYASVGAVLSGAVFGDHCSPISDTTALSSLAAGCSLQQHVWTQMPYAVVVAVVAMLSGDVMCREFDLNPGIGLLVGAAALLLIVLTVGRPPRVTGDAHG